MGVGYDMGCDGEWDWFKLALPFSSRHLQARIASSFSRAVRPKGMVVGVALGFLSDAMMSEDEGE